VSTPRAGGQVPLVIEPDPDEPGFASVLVDATIAGRPYRLVLDTGAVRTQLNADEYTSALPPAGEDASSGIFGGSITMPVVTVTDVAIRRLSHHPPGGLAVRLPGPALDGDELAGPG
jgi:hypothetical protein